MSRDDDIFVLQAAIEGKPIEDATEGVYMVLASTRLAVLKAAMASCTCGDPHADLYAQVDTLPAIIPVRHHELGDVWGMIVPEEIPGRTIYLGPSDADSLVPAPAN
jgi:hypothetical protein